MLWIHGQTFTNLSTCCLLIEMLRACNEIKKVSEPYLNGLKLFFKLNTKVATRQDVQAEVDEHVPTFTLLKLGEQLN